MGVDYSPLGGIGIRVTKEYKKKLIVANEGETYDGDMVSVIEELGITAGTSGSGSYTGEENDYYMMVDGSTLMEINQNSAHFIKTLNSFGIDITEKDLEVIEELHIW